MRWTGLFLPLILGAQGFAASPLLIVENQLLPSPAAADSAASQLARGENGIVYLCWLENTSSSGKVLRMAQFDPKKSTWDSARTICAGTDIDLDPASTPQIAANTKSEVVATWFVRSRGSNQDPSTQALVDRSIDGGVTWSRPQPLTTESTSQEFVSILALPDTRFIALWLDGRASHAAGGAQTLRSRILFSDAKDQLLDPRVCDCCPTAVAGFPDGSALAVYRDRSDEEIRDISVVRFHLGTWSSPARLSHDDWKIDGCPVNGPAISASGSHVAAAWYTAAGDKPAVYLSISEAAGEPFLMPARVDDGKPLGYVAVIQLHDGTALVSWVERGLGPADAVIWLRRVSPDGTLSVPARLALSQQHRLSGIPRLALLKDSDASAAQVILSYTQVEGGVPHVSTRLITISPAEADRNPCALCPPEDTRGSPLHGYIRSVNTAAGTARVKHDEVAGVMPPMTMHLNVAPEELAKLAPEDEVFGRLERRADGWWLFSIKIMPRTSPPNTR